MTKKFRVEDKDHWGRREPEKAGKIVPSMRSGRNLSRRADSHGASGKAGRKGQCGTIRKIRPGNHASSPGYFSCHEGKINHGPERN